MNTNSDQGLTQPERHRKLTPNRSLKRRQIMPATTADAESRTELLEMETEEMWRQVEAEARRRLGMSAKEMLTLDSRGELPDPGRVRDLLMVARLLNAPSSNAA